MIRAVTVAALAALTPAGPAAQRHAREGANSCVAAPSTRIAAIQGAGAAAALTGRVRIRGVVVGDFEGPAPALRGFYLQDPDGDGDPATSDAIFVFNGDRDLVRTGDLVAVTGTAAEFEGQTQVGASTVAVCGTGTVAATDVTLPLASADALERFEGMLVRLPDTLHVTEHHHLARFGFVVLSSGGRLPRPTDLAEPGPRARAIEAANDLNRLIVDDGVNDQNPDPIRFGRNAAHLSAANTLRAGDTATGIVGVMTYTWSGHQASGPAWRVRPFGALGGHVRFVPANLRPVETPPRRGVVRVASANVLNYFNTFDGPGTAPPWGCALGTGGAPTDCRGADDRAEFARQWPKTVAAIVETHADVVALQELENDGYGPASAIAHLVDRLNAASARGTYAFVDADAATGTVDALGTDAIRVALVYKPAHVAVVGRTAALSTPAFVNGGDAFPRNRPALAQAFELRRTGARFVLAVNHLKSKSSACDAPDRGDGQGECSRVRTRAAQVLRDWLATDPTGTGDPDVLIVGDLNSYSMEDPVRALTSGAGAFRRLVPPPGGPETASYVFDGEWGSLDHALASASLVPQVVRTRAWTINADEPGALDYNTNFKSPGHVVTLYAPDPFRMGDHNPLLVDLVLARDRADGAPSRRSRR